jgi:hypothetical protein
VLSHVSKARHGAPIFVARRYLETARFVLSNPIRKCTIRVGHPFSCGYEVLEKQVFRKVQGRLCVAGCGGEIDRDPLRVVIVEFRIP